MPILIGGSGLLAVVIGDGNAVAATATQTSLLTGSASAGVFTLPAGWLGPAGGAHFKLYAAGRISTPAATQGNVTFTLRIGSVNAAVTPTFVSLISLTNITWELEWDITFRATGSGTTANAMHTGKLFTALVSATNLVNLIPATAPAIGTGFDSTAGQTIDLQVTWSNATAGNTITLQQYALTQLNAY